MDKELNDSREVIYVFVCGFQGVRSCGNLSRYQEYGRSCHLLTNTGELGYDGPLYEGFLHMTDDMLSPGPMHIKYSSYVYDGFCI